MSRTTSVVQAGIQKILFLTVFLKVAQLCVLKTANFGQKEVVSLLAEQRARELDILDVPVFSSFQSFVCSEKGCILFSDSSV